MKRLFHSCLLGSLLLLAVKGEAVQKSTGERENVQTLRPRASTNGVSTRDDSPAFALFQGPAKGTISGGASVSTDDFSLSPARPSEAAGREPFVIPMPHFQRRLLNDRERLSMPRGPLGSNFVQDLSTRIPENNSLKLLTSFAGLPDPGNVIPPDPHMTVGPNHVVGTVNRQFGIYDKGGNVLKIIDADDWFANVNPGGKPFDPQIVYDRYESRWIMAWIDFMTNPPRSFLLLSISDDANPLGQWCNWRLPGNQNGSTANNFLNDYPKMGFNEDAIYVTANMFEILSNDVGAFQYVQLRIIPKGQLLSNSCGAVTWTDFWDLRNPSAMSFTVFTTVPAVTFGTPGVEYFVDVDFVHATGSFMNLWSLTNPLASVPTLTATTVPVVAFQSPPDADQLGGGTPRIDVGDRQNRNVVYQNGSVWTSHSVADPTGQFANARYVRIDVNTAQAIEDIAFGAEDFWYYYPAVQPDGNGNLVMCFTRSGITEYASARFTGRQSSDPPGLEPSMLLKVGENNYVKTFGEERNRWGDYMGIALDPADNNQVWMFVEYAAPPANTWGTWFGSASFAENLSGSVSAAVNSCLANMPQNCHITIDLTVDLTTTLPVERLGSFTGSLQWDPTKLNYESNSGLLAGFTGAVNTSNISTGRLTFNGASPNGAGNVVTVLEVTFKVTGPVGSNGLLDLNFSAMAAAATFTNLLPTLSVSDCNFTISAPGLSGDVNGNGSVNSTDALIVLSYDASLPISPAFLALINQGYGDVNADGVTNSTDALIILSYDVSLPVPFPVGQSFCP